MPARESERLLPSLAYASYGMPRPDGAPTSSPSHTENGAIADWWRGPSSHEGLRGRAFCKRHMSPVSSRNRSRVILRFDRGRTSSKAPSARSRRDISRSRGGRHRPDGLTPILALSKPDSPGPPDLRARPIDSNPRKAVCRSSSCPNG